MYKYWYLGLVLVYSTTRSVTLPGSAYILAWLKNCARFVADATHYGFLITGGEGICPRNLWRGVFWCIFCTRNRTVHEWSVVCQKRGRGREQHCGVVGLLFLNLSMLQFRLCKYNARNCVRISATCVFAGTRSTKWTRDTDCIFYLTATHAKPTNLIFTSRDCTSIA